jgi:mannose-6-phosphate isomerase-like protein (cupin superfamily)
VSSELVTAPLAGGTVAPPGSNLVLTEVLDGGGADPPTYIAPLHVHDRDDEAWYVLEGELAFLLDGSEVRVAAGGGVVVPAGTEHTFWNPSTGRARYLIVMTATVHRLVEALHDPGRHGDMGALFRAHDSTLIGWP